MTERPRETETTERHDGTAPRRLDAEISDRSKSPYTSGEKVRRVIWNYLGQLLMRLTFHNWYALRNELLRLFGAEIGRNVRIRPNVNIEQPWNLTIGENSSVGDNAILYCLGTVTIGKGVSISQYAHICAGTHDYEQPDMPLLRPSIVLEDNVWIAADAFVGPGVTVGEGAVLGARSSVYKDMSPRMVYAGNPAREIKKRIMRDAHGVEQQE